MSNGRTLSVILNLSSASKWLVGLQEQATNLLPKVKEKTPSDKFHLTMLYANGFEEEALGKAAEEMQSFLKELGGPAKIRIGPMKVLHNADGDGVVYASVMDPSQINKIHQGLKKISDRHGGQYTYKEFKPHITLAYADGEISGDLTRKLSKVEMSQETTSGKFDVSSKEGDGWKVLNEVKLTEVTIIHMAVKDDDPVMQFTPFHIHTGAVSLEGGMPKGNEPIILNVDLPPMEEIKKRIQFRIAKAIDPKLRSRVKFNFRDGGGDPTDLPVFDLGLSMSDKFPHLEEKEDGKKVIESTESEPTICEFSCGFCDQCQEEDVCELFREVYY